MSTCNNFCPVWSECGYEHKGHCDCVQQRKFKPAPQAQEEPGGAPAPAGSVPVEGRDVSPDGTTVVRGYRTPDGVIHITGQERVPPPQPPAPASPAGRLWLCSGCCGWKPATEAGGHLVCSSCHTSLATFQDPAAPEAGAPGTRKPTRVVRNHEGERCAVCDATYDHFHGYDAHGEVPGKFDGSDWDLTTLPRPGAPGTQGAT